MQPHEVTIATLRAWHRQRCFFMEQRKRQYLALGAFLRERLGWSLSLPEKERNAIAKRAQDMIANGEGEWCDVIGAVTHAAAPFEAKEAEARKEMERLAKTLPVWASFAEHVRGFGAVSLAVIVAEAGDLANYPTIGHLTKRMGLAPINGKAASTWRKSGGLNKDGWIEAGYSPPRRSRMWTIGDSLMKGNRDGKYRTIYLSQKEKYIARGWPKLHSHRAAQRYMEQRLLKDLWRAWRETKMSLADDRPIGGVSPAKDSGLEARP